MLAAVLSLKSVEMQPTKRHVYFALRESMVIYNEDKRDPPQHRLPAKKRKGFVMDPWENRIYGDLYRAACCAGQFVTRLFPRKGPMYFRPTLNLHKIFLEANPAATKNIIDFTKLFLEA